MDFFCDSKYIIVPASHHAQNKRLLFYIDNRLVYDFVAALDYDSPDYEFPLNVERFMGKLIHVECDIDVDINFRKCDEFVTDYCGKYRPYAHFTAKRGWLNDPNGLTCYKGKYLMFYQHNPVAVTWENMHWGYAVSNDLIHWQEKDIALFPDENGTMFSGSAIIDHRNVTGLKENDNDVILLFYTAAGSTSETAKGKPFTQSLAYSTDGGETFKKYDKNPLIDQLVGGNRDPKVIYHEPTDRYIMALYLDNHEYALFASDNLLDWTLLQKLVLPEEAECPDFYPLPVDGDKDKMKWVFIGASDKYYIGSFDGTVFTPETELKALNYGNNSYAAQSWSDAHDSRRIRTSFATVVIPGMPFGSCMSIPQEMTLKTINNEICLCAEPIHEICSLYERTDVIDHITVTTEHPFVYKTEGKAYDISLKIALNDNSAFHFRLFGFHISYDANSRELKCLDKTTPITPAEDHVDLRLIIDTVYAEIFVNYGNPFLGMTYIQDSSLNTLKISAEQESIQIEHLKIARLQHIWK